jgi:hypothetical protein
MSSTRTLRIENDLLEALEEMASEQRVSVNLAVNRALRRYVEWDSAERSRGYVSVPSGLLSKLMSFLTVEKAQELGRSAATSAFIPNMRRRNPIVSVQSVVDDMKMAAKYTGRYTFDYTEKEGRGLILLRQQLGRNWSGFYAASLEEIFRVYLKKKVKVTEGYSICTFQFDV